VTRVIIGDLLTGRRILDLPYLSYRWSRSIESPEAYSVTANLADPDTRALDLRNAATPGKTLVAIVEESEGGEWFAAAGGMNEPDYDGDAQSLTMPGNGLGSVFSSRTVLPVAAQTIDPSLFTIPDPLDATKTIPNPAVGTSFSSVDYGTMIKKLYQQALAWPSSAFPIVFGSDVVGPYSKSWDGVDFKKLAEAVQDIMKLDNGVEVRLQPRYQSDRRGVEWVLLTGTVAQPQIMSTSVFRWTIGPGSESTKGLRVGWDASQMSSVAWATGGRSTDIALVRRAYSSALLDAGYPLRESVDSSHTDVSDPTQLLSYATRNLASEQGPVEQISFQAKKDVAPFVGQYAEGDLVILTSHGDPYIEDGELPPRRIASLSGDESNWVTITTEEI
jgi:hypothetical protein